MVERSDGGGIPGCERSAGPQADCGGEIDPVQYGTADIGVRSGGSERVAEKATGQT